MQPTWKNEPEMSLCVSYTVNGTGWGHGSAWACAKEMLFQNKALDTRHSHKGWLWHRKIYHNFCVLQTHSLTYERYDRTRNFNFTLKKLKRQVQRARRERMEEPSEIWKARNRLQVDRCRAAPEGEARPQLVTRF